MYACNGMMHLCQATGRWPTEMIEYADVVQVCLARASSGVVKWQEMKMIFGRRSEYQEYKSPTEIRLFGKLCQSFLMGKHITQ